VDVDHRLPRAQTTRAAPGVRRRTRAAMAAFQGELGARAILTAKEHHIA
jgi:hypothetical protein